MFFSSSVPTDLHTTRAVSALRDTSKFDHFLCQAVYSLCWGLLIQVTKRFFSIRVWVWTVKGNWSNEWQPSCIVVSLCLLLYTCNSVESPCLSPFCHIRPRSQKHRSPILSTPSHCLQLMSSVFQPVKWYNLIMELNTLSIKQDTV